MPAPPMVLYVMRHGPAEDRAPTGRDFDRALTPDGKRVVERAAAAIHRARGGASIPRLLASPFTRARETAEILRATLACPAVELRDDLGADEGLPLGLVRDVAEDGVDVLLVGHQPTVEQLVRTLVAPASPPLGSGFRTAMVVALAPRPPPDAHRWQVVDLVDPHRPT
jgi:phosphohistidine phosphatase